MCGSISTSFSVVSEATLTLLKSKGNSLNPCSTIFLKSTYTSSDLFEKASFIICNNWGFFFYERFDYFMFLIERHKHHLIFVGRMGKRWIWCNTLSFGRWDVILDLRIWAFSNSCEGAWFSGCWNLESFVRKISGLGLRFGINKGDIVSSCSIVRSFWGTISIFRVWVTCVCDHLSFFSFFVLKSF